MRKMDEDALQAVKDADSRGRYVTPRSQAEHMALVRLRKLGLVELKGWTGPIESSVQLWGLS